MNIRIGRTLAHHPFEEQARLHPNAPAISCGGLELTYGEVDSIATRLSARLIELGARPETVVGIDAERFGTTLVAMLGVLKSGAAYVPVDLDEAPDRAADILRGCNALALISEREGLEALVKSAVERIDPWLEDVAGQDGTRNDIAPDDLAYIIYTSGSTGSPKGVCVAHRQITASTVAHFAFDADLPPKVFLLLPPFNFDGVGFGVYWTLARGGKLVIPTDVQIRDVELLAQLCAEEGVTHLDGTPSVYASLLRYGAEKLTTLRYANLGGEVCPPELVARHFAAVPTARLVNAYGPTECTVWCAQHTCVPADAERARIPVGTAIPGYEVLLLDDELQDVAPGEVGEICIAGAGVARGYHGESARTARSFVPIPHGRTPGGRMYRTGDMGVLTVEGEIEFLGREDRQIKLRGYRIELDEIERALRNRPGVVDAAVVLTSSDQRTPYIAAYFTTADASPPTPEDLRSGVAEQLPSYMIPQVVRCVPALPKTTSGKIDHAALSRHESCAQAGGQESEREHAQQPAQVDGALATTITRIVADALESTNQWTDGQLPADRDLFTLGLNSISMTIIASRIRNEVGVGMRTAALFARPTIRGIHETVAKELETRLEQPALAE